MNKPVDSHLPLADARRLTQRVHFERDGTVTIASGKVDLGQGISTALAQIAAEELGVALSKVKILPASTAYSPNEGVTSGSLSIQDGGTSLRKAQAHCRRLLGCRPVRRHPGRHEHHPREAELPGRLLAEQQVPEVDGVAERSEHADARGVGAHHSSSIPSSSAAPP